MPMRLAHNRPWKSHHVAALSIRERPVVRVDIRNYVVGNKLFKVSGRHRTRIYRSVLYRLAVRKHHNHFFGALREGPSVVCGT